MLVLVFLEYLEIGWNWDFDFRILTEISMMRHLRFRIVETFLICNRNETCKKEDNRRQSSIKRNENSTDLFLGIRSSSYFMVFTKRLSRSIINYQDF